MMLYKVGDRASATLLSHVAESNPDNHGHPIMQSSRGRGPEPIEIFEWKKNNKLCKLCAT